MNYVSNVNKTYRQFRVEASFVNNIFQWKQFDESAAIRLFQHQWQHNEIYRRWCDLMHCKPGEIERAMQIPFLPISFFKTHPVVTGEFKPQIIFTSSGTTQTVNSRHLVKDINVYRKSFITAFELFYSHIKDLCIIGLLPSYLERQGSSLVFMVDELIQLSKHPQSGFYLYDFKSLRTTLRQLEAVKQPTLLIGVTFALLDFAEASPMPLQHTAIMETGGMKGRKQEMTREEVHAKLKSAFHLQDVHSEYSMTELMSQAYSKGGGIYYCPPWMKVFVREDDDPLTVKEQGRGVLNIIDLANADSCAFIATDDAGIIQPEGSFEVQGRTDYSDLRGCSLLTL